MRLAMIMVLLGAAATTTVTTLAIEPKETVSPIKLDKTLRRALLKALADLEEESDEQYRQNDTNDDMIAEPSSAMTLPDITKKDLDKKLEVIRKTTFSFPGFPGNEELPGEDRLQNSSYVKIDQYESSDSLDDEEIIMSSVEPRVRSEDFQVQDAAMTIDKSSTGTYGKTVESLDDQEETGDAKNSSPSSSSSSDNDNVQNTTSGMNGDSLVAPKPTVSSLTVQSKSSDSYGNPIVSSKEKSEESQEVKIFQAPLVAAFTVQQDERGVPKSVVPIYRQTGDGQALTLQEQLEFKQKLLEKQLAELQRQQLQQTQFLAKQRELLYEQQLRQKQRQFLQEQARLKQLEEQRLYQLQQQQSFDRNNLLTLQPPFKTSNVHVQPSVSLQVPHVGASPFRSNYQEQQQQPQNFSPFSIDLQLPLVPAVRFHRQESFGSIENFGLNGSNSNRLTSNNINYPTNFIVQTRSSQSNFSPQSLPRHGQTRSETPAKQIQHLLYQSGVVSDLNSVQGSGGPEDLNIVSKVLALNVGAIPSNGLQFGGANRPVVQILEAPNSA